MNKTLVILILVIIVLSWNFIFSSDKKIELTDQARVLQGISLSMKHKFAVKKYWQEKKYLPNIEQWQEAGNETKVDLSKSVVKKIEVGVDAPGAITVHFVNKENARVAQDIDDKKVMLMPMIIDKKLTWVCSGDLPLDLLPKRCRKMKTE